MPNKNKPTFGHPSDYTDQISKIIISPLRTDCIPRTRKDPNDSANWVRISQLKIGIVMKKNCPTSGQKYPLLREKLLLRAQ